MYSGFEKEDHQVIPTKFSDFTFDVWEHLTWDNKSYE
jgi:hypothetical protein